ncbi:uncharacterized protein ACNS7B_004086 [Menidia menidia]
MSTVNRLKYIIKEQLLNAAEEICKEFENTIVRYEEEIDTLRKQLEGFTGLLKSTPHIKLHRIGFPEPDPIKESDVPAVEGLKRGETSDVDPEEAEPPVRGEELELEPPSSPFGAPLNSEGSDVTDSDSVVELSVFPGKKRLMTNIKPNAPQRPSDSADCSPTPSSPYEYEYEFEYDAEQPDPRESRAHPGEQLFNWERLGLKENEGLVSKDFEELCGRRQAENREVATNTNISVSEELDEGKPGSGTEQVLPLSSQSDAQNQTSSYKGRGAPKPRRIKGQPLCETCGVRMKNRYQVAKHRELHSGKKHICPVCHKSFNLRSSLSAHSKNHREPQMPSCQICKKQFPREELALHMETHAEVRTFVCDVCGQSFLTRQSLSAHTVSHRASDRAVHTCQRCRKTFLHEHQLLAHLGAHSREGSLSCETCGRTFSGQRMLMKHRRNPCLSCKICGQQLPSRLDKAAHMKTHQRHDCFHCKKSYLLQRELEAHLPKCLTERPCLCQFCGRRFKYPVTLSNHVRIHSAAAAAPVVRHEGKASD